MTKSQVITSILVFLIIAGIQSCQKSAGEGGLASIRGKVFGYDINPEGQIKDSAYIGNVRVNLSFGENSWFDEQTVTSSSGDYSFDGLNVGKYTITVFSQCNACIFNEEAVVVKTEIRESKEIVKLPDIKIKD